MGDLLQRGALALLVLVAAVAPPRGVSARACPSPEDVITQRGGDDELVTHPELVRAPAVADARVTVPAATLRRPARVEAARPPVHSTVHVAQARARRAFTRPRVRLFRPSDPDDF